MRGNRHELNDMIACSRSHSYDVLLHWTSLTRRHDYFHNHVTKLVRLELAPESSSAQDHSSDPLDSRSLIVVEDKPLGHSFDQKPRHSRNSRQQHTSRHMTRCALRKVGRANAKHIKTLESEK
ncbi:hypothetical protein Q1695_012156 [Nippostrongylus brasiliensis]|nr:hypothetical protein Q1695_012156 [Nippostrongylus brasiliensis]